MCLIVHTAVDKKAVLLPSRLMTSCKALAGADKATPNVLRCFNETSLEFSSLLAVPRGFRSTYFYAI